MGADKDIPQVSGLWEQRFCRAAAKPELCHIGYRPSMAQRADKPIVWLKGEVKTPPFGERARIEAGLLLRRLQQGQNLSLPHSRPMPTIGGQCHELRIQDRDQTWRIFYYLGIEAVVILDVLCKKTEATPAQTLETCRKRLWLYRKIEGNEE